MVAMMTTILLVDDDPLQAFVRMSALDQKFHDVKRVSDLAEALCMVEQPQFAHKFRLIIADLHRPGPLAAPAFVAEMHSRLPGVPVLVLGGAKDAPADYAGHGVRFLPQTIAADDMLSAASQLLSSESGRVQ